MMTVIAMRNAVNTLPAAGRQQRTRENSASFRRFSNENDRSDDESDSESPNSLLSRDLLPARNKSATYHRRRYHRHGNRLRNHARRTDYNREKELEKSPSLLDAARSDIHQRQSKINKLNRSTSTIDSILLRLRTQEERTVGVTSEAPVLSAPPVNRNKIKPIDPHTKENELEKDITTVRFSADTGKRLLDLHGGLNPDIEVTIEVLHDDDDDDDEYDLPVEVDDDFFKSRNIVDYNDYDFIYDVADNDVPPGTNKVGDTGIEAASGVTEMETEIINTDSYGSAEIELPVQLYEWSSWSACSVKCGDGSRERERPCGNFCVEKQSSPCQGRLCDGSVGKGRQTLDSSYPLFIGGGFLDIPNVETMRGTILPLLDEDADTCEAWKNCTNEFLIGYVEKLRDLPACPCFYPVNLPYNENIFDEANNRYFSWRDASATNERLDIYKPGAANCIRSLLSEHSSTLAAQHCCYDNSMRLITRGVAAGTPNLISPEISPELHHKVDVLPWIMCKGDWTRYNQVRPPNNSNNCAVNPDDEEFRKQTRDAQDF